VSDALTRQQQQRSQSGVIRYVLAGSANHSLVQAVGPLFLLSLGAAPFHLGLLAAVSQLDKLSRLVGVELLARGVGKTQLMLWGRLLTMPVTGLLVLCALAGAGGTAAVWIAIAVMAARALLQQTGNAAWWPLIQDVTGGAGLGSFLTRMRSQQRLLELAMPLAVGAWLGSAPAAERFTPIFGLAVVALGAGALSIRVVSELPSTSAGGALVSRMRQTLSVPAVARCFRFMGLRALLHSACFPFWIVALTDRGLPASQFVWLGSILAGGQILSLWFWGRLVDRHGYRPALLPGVGGMVLLAGAWLWLPDGGWPLLAWGAAIFLLWGILEAGVQMGQSRVMVDAMPEGLKAEGFAVVMLGSALGGGLGGLAGGSLFTAAGAASSDVHYLAGVQALFVVPLLLARRLGGNPLPDDASQAS
jgi:hypothetical protein